MSPSDFARAGPFLAALAALTGCTTLSGNVKGSFACSAPEGSCAPTSVIDDRALAVITGGRDAAPAPAALLAQARARVRAADIDRLTAPTTTRTGERVLRIVFPAHIDEAGRLHETAAVRTVVAPGHWRPVGALTAGDDAPEGTLAAALEGADVPDPAPAIGSADLPDPAAVAAARVRRDPVAAIKAEVDSRLARARPRDQGLPAPTLRSGAATTGSATDPTAGKPGTATTTVHALSFPTPSGEDR